MEIGRDEASQRGSEHRAEQGRDGEVADGLDIVGLRDGLEDDDASDRHHQGAPYALNEAGCHEREERARHGAQKRARREHQDRRAKHRARAEPVREPARDGDEHPETDDIGGETDLQRDRILAEVAGHGRQGGRDHRAIDVLHQECATHEQGQDEGVSRLNGHKGGPRQDAPRRTPGIDDLEALFAHRLRPAGSPRAIGPQHFSALRLATAPAPEGLGRDLVECEAQVAL